MTCLHFTDEKDAHGALNNLLEERLKKPFIILRTASGKPYIEGDPVFFSLSHSGGRAVIAISEKPVGVDLEVYGRKNYAAILKRFSKREQAEIDCEKQFLLHWTAREAFIKMRGATLAEYFKRLEFYGGKIYFDGKEQNCKITFEDCGFGIVTVCEEK